MSKTSCFITGATGFLGLNLAIQILDNNLYDNLYLLARKKSKRRSMLDKVLKKHSENSKVTVKIVEGDIVDFDRMVEVIPNDCSVLIHSAANLAIWKKEYKIQSKINIDGTRNIVNACIEKKVKKLVHISTGAVYGFQKSKNSKLPMIDETTPRKGHISGLSYARTKYFSEEEVKKGIKKGLDACIIQPGFIFGEYDRFGTTNFIRAIYYKVITSSFGGYIGFADVVPLSKAILVAAKKGRCGHSYILGGVTTTWKKFFDIISDVLKVKKLPVGSYWTFYAKALADEMYSQCVGKRPRLTRDAINLWFLKCGLNNSKAEKELDYDVGDLKESVERVVKFMKEMKLIAPKNSKKKK